MKRLILLHYQVFQILKVRICPWGARILMGAFIFGIIGLFTVVGVLYSRLWMVPLCILNPFLGDLSHHGNRHKSHPGGVFHLSHWVSGGEIVHTEQLHGLKRRKMI